MITARSPGIYFQETSSGARPIQAVGTSTAGFVGIAPDPSAEPGRAVRVLNWQHFRRVFIKTGGVSTNLARAVYGFFQNGGASLFVCNIDQEEKLAEGLEALGRIDEIAIVAAPGFTGAQHWSTILSHCHALEDRVAILDAPSDVPDLENLKTVAQENDQDAGARPPASDRGFGAYYFPWIGVRDPVDSAANIVFTPPSGHIAGIYARSDALRGVHKAPANETVEGALSLKAYVHRAEQASLNEAGVNCIRFFPAEGFRVWGARTLAPKGSEWTYINVRRLFNMIQESIAESTRWVVFEPNDASLWKSIRRDVSAFLLRIYRTGALRGASPEEAFFVQCDEETNPPEVIDAGEVVTVIGIAPVKPAEFVVFRIGQTAGGSATSEGGDS